MSHAFQFKVRLVTEKKTWYALKSEAPTWKRPARDFPKFDNIPKSLHDINNKIIWSKRDFSNVINNFINYAKEKTKLSFYFLFRIGITWTKDYATQLFRKKYERCAMTFIN